MSEFKNDPTGLKQKLAALVFTVAALALLLIFSTGARISCVQNECTLTRHEIGHTSSERFSWKEVTAVFTRPVAVGRTVTGGRAGISLVNLVLDLGPTRSVTVFASGVAWIIGPIEYKTLEAARNKGWSNDLYGFSLGGASLAVSIVLALVGLILALFSMVTAIRPGMPAADLSAARKSNLLCLVAVLLAGTAFWSTVAITLMRWLTA